MKALIVTVELNYSSFSWGAPPANPGGPQAPTFEASAISEVMNHH